MTRTPTPNAGAPCADTEQQSLCRLVNIQSTALAGGGPGSFPYGADTPIPIREVGPVVTATANCAQVGVDGSADQIVAYDATAIETTITNHSDTEDFYIGGSGVATSNGELVRRGTSLTKTGGAAKIAWYGITTGAAITVGRCRVVSP